MSFGGVASGFEASKTNRVKTDGEGDQPGEVRDCHLRAILDVDRLLVRPGFRQNDRCVAKSSTLCS
jgi:hypothetical protein